MNDLPIGPSVDGPARPFPKRQSHVGLVVRLDPLSLDHVPGLWRAAEGAEASWTYLRYGPFATRDAFAEHVATLAAKADQPFFAVVPSSSGAAEGWLSYCDVEPANAAIEIGSIWFSPRLQRTRASTEALFLLMRHALSDLEYRRLVWRCDALNAASMRAARRLGFVYEGTWRASDVLKGRQRDTAWFSILAAEWPRNRSDIECWLDDDNFDSHGRARRALRAPAEEGDRAGIAAPTSCVNASSAAVHSPVAPEDVLPRG